MIKLEVYKYISKFFFIICAALIYSNHSYSQPLDYLINKILSQDESINSSKILIEKSKNDVSSAWSSYTPKLDLTIPIGREVLINNDNANTDLNFYEVDAKITQNLYDFGATGSKIDIAKNQLEASKVSSENIKSAKILEALSAYLNYLKTYNVLKYAKESENRIKSVTRLENEKVARGAGLASNVLQSKARLAGARSIRVRFEGDLAIAKNRFFNVFREIPQEFSTFKEPSLPINMLPLSEEEAIKIARKNNIALKVSNLNLKNSQKKIKGSKAKFLPSLKAVAQYNNKRNFAGLEGTEIDHTYKIEMNYPISIGGPFGFFYKENADYRSSMNQYMAIKYNHDKLERDLEESIRNSWQTKKIAQKNYEFLENQANISGEFFDLAMKEVKLGNRQLIDILSSETAFINAKSSAENAKTEYQLAVYQLLFSLGVLDESLFINKQSNDSNR
ncbi:MAG: TolC family protein, partial [Pseudomonadota bacterium]|nr:TolC family protein [Pseudomonadota bacterium]